MERHTIDLTEVFSTLHFSDVDGSTTMYTLYVPILLGWKTCTWPWDSPPVMSWSPPSSLQHVTCLLFRIFPLKYLFSNFEKLAYKVPPFSIAIFYFWWSLAQANPLHHLSSPHSYWNLLAPRTTPTTFISCVQLSSHSSFLMSFPSCGQLSSFLASIHTQSHMNT